MSEIIELRDIKLSKMSPDELIVESIESIAIQLEGINKSLNIMHKRLYALEQTVFAPSENSPSHE
jgi:hypothetical protein